MKSPRYRRILLIAGIAIASIGGLLFVLEQAPMKWQVWLTPAYRFEWESAFIQFTIEEAEERQRVEWLEDYTEMLGQIEPGENEVYSEKHDRFFHVDFIRSEVIRTGNRLEEFREKRQQPSRPSYLKYLWNRMWPSRSEN